MQDSHHIYNIYKDDRKWHSMPKSHFNRVQLLTGMAATNQPPDWNINSCQGARNVSAAWHWAARSNVETTNTPLCPTLTQGRSCLWAGKISDQKLSCDAVLAEVAASPSWSSSECPCSHEHAATDTAALRWLAHMGCTCMRNNPTGLHKVNKVNTTDHN